MDSEEPPNVRVACSGDIDEVSCHRGVFVDWTIAATVGAPIIALFVGAALDRKLERKPRLITFLTHASAVRVNPTEGEPFNINSHAVVVRNAGRLTATNVRLGHNHLPNDFSVWPASEHSIQRRPDGTAEVVFPTLVPNEQIVVTYIYPAPVTVNQINSYTKCDQSYAQVVTAITAPLKSPLAQGIKTGLATYGAIMLLTAAWQGVVWLYKNYAGS